MVLQKIHDMLSAWTIMRYVDSQVPLVQHYIEFKMTLQMGYQFVQVRSSSSKCHNSMGAIESLAQYMPLFLTILGRCLG